MGCVSTKSTTETKSPPKIPAKGRDEEKFHTMNERKEVKTKDDVVVKPSDFVITHKSAKAFSQHYKLDPNILGEGAFGRVQKCTRKGTNEERAVKIIDKHLMNEVEKTRLLYEIDILKNLNHPNIVRLYEVFEDKMSIFLVTELCDGKELFDEIIQRVKFTELEAAIVTKQMLQVMAYCHEKKVAHRDLKPENVLIDSKNKGAIKVIDFGTSHVFDGKNHEMHQMYGTAYYIAPEVLSGTYTEKCDLWSIGVILYVMLSGKPPFNGKTDPQILANVKKGDYVLDDYQWLQRSEDVRSLIRQLMEKNPKKRLSAQEALQHPWILRKVHAEFDKQLATQSLENLKDFRAEAKLKTAAITFMVTHMTTKQEQAELKKTFNLFDTNGDGKIEKQEFIDSYKKVYTNLDETQVIAQASEFFERADADNNGNIDYGEWCAATINRRNMLNEANLKGCFQLFDRDGGGSISAQEVAEILGGSMIKEKKVWDEIIKEVDLNGDGLIDFQEFKTMMQKMVGVQ